MFLTHFPFHQFFWYPKYSICYCLHSVSISPSVSWCRFPRFHTSKNVLLSLVLMLEIHSFLNSGITKITVLVVRTPGATLEELRVTVLHMCCCSWEISHRSRCYLWTVVLFLLLFFFCLCCLYNLLFHFGIPLSSSFALDVVFKFFYLAWDFSRYPTSGDMFLLSVQGNSQPFFFQTLSQSYSLLSVWNCKLARYGFSFTLHAH